MTDRNYRRPRVLEERFRQVTVVFGNLGKASELLLLDDCEIQSGLGVVVEDDGVDYMTSTDEEFKAEIAESDIDFDLRDLLMDEAE